MKAKTKKIGIVLLVIGVLILAMGVYFEIKIGWEYTPYFLIGSMVVNTVAVRLISRKKQKEGKTENVR